MGKETNKKDEVFVFLCGDETPRPLIEEGAYETQVIKMEIKPFMRKEKRLYLHHQITPGGKHAGTVLFQSINASYERFGDATKFYQQWRVANYGQKPRKGQNMSPKVFENKIFKAMVKTVKSKGGQLYSVVDVIVDVIAPDPPNTNTFTNANTGSNTVTRANTNTKPPASEASEINEHFRQLQ